MRKLKSSFVALIVVGGLSSCSTPPATVVSNSVAAATIALTTAENAALAYTTLPRCGPMAPRICSDAGVVLRIKELDQKAYEAVKLAQQNERMVGAALTAIEQLKAAIPR